MSDSTVNLLPALRSFSRKRYPLVNASIVNANLPAVGFQKSDYAIVTTLFTDSYAPAVATLGHSLRKTNTMARLIVLYLPSHISREALCIATSSGFVPHPVERIPPKDGGSGMDPHFLDTYTKLQLWRLDTLPNPVRALVYLDSDTLALRNFDELFLLPHHFAAAPDIWPETHGFVTLINSGVMFIRPDAALYDAMVESIPQARYQRRMGDQGFLDQFFATDVVRLPYAYNANIAIKMRSQQTWAGIKNETRLIHYTVEKPFVAHGKWKSFPVDAIPRRVKDAGNAHGGLYREEMELWGNMWQETQSVYSTEFLECRGR